MSNNGQVVVITGATGGMGRAIAAKFLENGYRLALLDLRKDGAEDWLNSLGDNAMFIECDITKRPEVDAARDKVLKTFGRIDVLVNNAGILFKGTPIEHVTEEAWRKMLDVNLTGTFHCTQAFGTPMLDRGGAIVNISSIAGLIPGPWRGAYSASKAGVLILTQQLANEWGPRKVRVNAVCPGFVITPMSAFQYEDPHYRELRQNMVPQRQIGSAEDVAKAVYYLASDEASYVNGEFVRVDGGLTTSPMFRLNLSHQG